MRIVLLGTGNLATRLGIALKAANSEIVQVYGRTESHASRLSGILGCPYTTCKTDIYTEADIFLLAVSDDSIASVMEGVPVTGQLLLHTSGSVSMSILSPFAVNYGVFYPLQTLSRQKELEFSKIPICLEANTTENLARIKALAESLSDTVIAVDSDQRRKLHLAAVFTCNFVNHLYTIGEALLREQGMDFNLLKPLIAETADKAVQFAPSSVQTGPAVRNNQKTMQMHLEMLKGHPEWKQLYELISNDIYHYHN